MLEPDFQRKKNSTNIKGNVLVDIKNKLRYPTGKSKISKKVKDPTEELVIQYKSSALPPLNLKTPKGANHSFNLDFIRGGSQTGKYQTLNNSKISIKPKMTKVDISKKSIQNSIIDREYILSGRSDAFGETKLKLIREFEIAQTTKNKVSNTNIFKQRKYTQQVET